MNNCHVSSQIDQHQKFLDDEEEFDQAVEEESERIKKDFYNEDESDIDEDFIQWCVDTEQFWYLAKAVKMIKQHNLTDEQIGKMLKETLLKNVEQAVHDISVEHAIMNLQGGEEL